MSATSGFSNWYADNVPPGALYAGGSNAGAIKLECTSDVTVASDGYTLTRATGWAGAEAGDVVCIDVTGSPEWRRIASITNNVASLIVATSAGLYDATDVTCKVGGANSSINKLALIVSNAENLNAAGLPHKVWIKGGTSYTAATGEAGGTGIVDIITNAGTAALPISWEGYTTTEGDGDDDCVVVDTTGDGPAYHGVYVNVAYHYFRFMRAASDTNAKSAWRAHTGGLNCLFEDISATATGNATSYGFYVYGSATVARLRVTAPDSYGVYCGYTGNAVIQSIIDTCGVGGVYSAWSLNGFMENRISNITGNGLTINNPNSGGMFDGNTFYNVSGDAIASAATTLPLVFTNNIFEKITGECVDMAGNCAIAFTNNACYDCGADDATYFDANVVNGDALLADATNKFSAGTLMVSPATGDFTPAGDALLNGYPANRDIGALQHTDAGAGLTLVNCRRNTLIGR